MRIHAASHIAVVCKSRHELARALGDEVAAWLAERGMSVSLCEGADALAGPDAASAYRCVVILGGDGTILGVARRLIDRPAPLFGINFGRVGFLTAANPHNWRERLCAALEPDAPLRRCLALRWSLVREGRAIGDGWAVNDLVVSRGALARLTCLGMSLAGRNMGLLRCDGVLFCTPVGSSGYSVSAGGPILHPEMDAIGITPICPFPSAIAPLVVPGGTQCALRVCSGSTDCYLTVDGQEGQELRADDEIRVTGQPDSVWFLGGGAPFFERLRQRGFALEQAEETRPGCRDTANAGSTGE